MPHQIEFSTLSNNQLLSAPMQIFPLHKIPGIQPTANYIGAFRVLQESQTKKRSLSFSINDLKISSMQMPTFSPKIVEEENNKNNGKCANKLCNSLLRSFTAAEPKLCSECHELYLKGQYCAYCSQIYDQIQGNIGDGLDWIQCDNCLKWVFN